ncbi:hypothetical protein WN66_03556 [Saccharomyces cerevisiae]|uniref:Putative uncharacterized protein YJL020W-A n=2 Tax=Saccharomyces cerevisiae TaxID=4932 RepID=YJ020_YEAST|nr:RecName: Full=Putative uncharacterized protein YJL020W-A [Saccharomyces cerevisiae S288C]AAL79271.1 unknown [Saccharomyces cerevisiae]KZV10254.1 hypothetical protein WN66_03556 [Saccharomyces cerevisiae]WNV73385.1 hypothetical protein O6U65_1287 [Saccharomyces cerevisiae synthetic construct]CAY80705.1 EC1118_1J11_2388p [Saccharomyces cerevisiae EC1118]
MARGSSWSCSGSSSSFSLCCFFFGSSDGLFPTPEAIPKGLKPTGAPNLLAPDSLAILSLNAALRFSSLSSSSFSSSLSPSLSSWP